MVYFKGKTLKSINKALNTHVFRPEWNEQSLELDLLHALRKCYKKWDWSQPVMPRRIALRELGYKKSYERTTELVRKGLLRESGNSYSMDDLGEEILRREVMAQLDDNYWRAAENFCNRGKR